MWNFPLKDPRSGLRLRLRAPRGRPNSARYLRLGQPTFDYLLESFCHDPQYLLALLPIEHKVTREATTRFYMNYLVSGNKEEVKGEF